MPEYTATIESEEPLGQFIDFSLETLLQNVNASVTVEEVDE